MSLKRKRKCRVVAPDWLRTGAFEIFQEVIVWTGYSKVERRTEAGRGIVGPVSKTGGSCGGTGESRRPGGGAISCLDGTET